MIEVFYMQPVIRTLQIQHQVRKVQHNFQTYLSHCSILQ